MIRRAARLAGVTTASSVGNGLIAIITARQLGPDGRGIIVLAITVMGFTTLFGSLGTNTAVRYYLGRPQRQVSIESYWAVTLILTLLQVTVLAVVLATTLRGIGFTPAISASTLIYGAISFVAYMVRDATNAIGHVTRSALYFACNCWLSLTFVYIAAKATGSVAVIILGMALGSVFEVVLNSFFLISQKQSLRPRWNGAEISLLMSRGVPALGLNAGQSLTFRVDRYIIGLVLGPSAVGIYSVAATLSETLRAVPAAFGQILLHQVASGKDDEEASRRSKKILLLVMIPPLTMLAIFAPNVINLLFGAEFDAAVTPLRILLLGEIAIMSFHIDSRRLTGMGRIGQAGLAGLVSLLLVVSLDVIFIPWRGILGAALASVFAYWALGTLTALILRRALRQKEAMHDYSKPV